MDKSAGSNVAKTPRNIIDGSVSCKYMLRARHVTGVHADVGKAGQGARPRARRKTEVLRQSFFPPPLQADLSDLEGYQYPPSIEYPDITIPEIEKAVRRASPNKAPGIDGITNGVLH